MPISFLFWNMMQRPLENRLARMVAAYDVDIVMLAECASDPEIVETALFQSSQRQYRLAITYNENAKTRVFARVGAVNLVDQFSDLRGRMTVRRLQRQDIPDMLLAVVHLPSKLNYSAEHQLLAATELAADIRNVERDTGISRTILVGDLNMNPFEPGVAAAGGLHAMMTRKLAERGERTVDGRSYPFFYNPMWGCFGDRTEGPPGTYYLSAANHDNYFWNMYDQVLLRPNLMNALSNLRILDTDGTESLVTRNGIPNKGAGSDHLPIFFQLEL